MRHLDRGRFPGGLLAGAILVCMSVGPAGAAAPPSETQLKELMDTAAQAPDSPDHDYVGNSIQSMLKQAKELQLTPQQTESIKTIAEQYERTKHDREKAYKQSEMDALKLIHDSHSSLLAIENAVQKADQEHSKLRMAGVKALREARDVLRPEQYSSWRQHHAARQMARSNPQQEREGEQGDSGRMAPH